jgi:hypothetical protein
MEKKHPEENENKRKEESRPAEAILKHRIQDNKRVAISGEREEKHYGDNEKTQAEERVNGIFFQF